MATRVSTVVIAAAVCICVAALYFASLMLRAAVVTDRRRRGAILMYCTRSIIDDWARYSIAINKQYARMHDYDLIVVSEPYDRGVTHAWQKLPAMVELLERNYDFVVYMDADAIVNKRDIKYEHFLAKYPGDIVVCSDEANSGGKYAVNGGMVIARNTPAAKALLRQWWALRYAYPEFAFEQWALSDIVRNKHPRIDGSIVSVAPETDFNSTYGEILAYVNATKGAELPERIPRPDRFVLHFMSMDSATRRGVLSMLYEEDRK